LSGIRRELAVMLQNMLQMAMSSVDEIEATCGPECYVSVRKAKDYIRETSMLIEANTRPKTIESENDLLFDSAHLLFDSQFRKDFILRGQMTGEDYAKLNKIMDAKGVREKPEAKSLQPKMSTNAGVGQLEKVGRLRLLLHRIRNFRRK
jgi:hypothetical protein